MDLRQFVNDTLVQIVQGVADASLEASKVGATVNPPRRGGGEFAAIHETGALIVNVEFTVALSVTEGTGTKGGIGVVAGVFALGSQGESRETNASTTHVRFTVPVALPVPRRG
jgi:hypothetical protein